MNEGIMEETLHDVDERIRVMEVRPWERRPQCPKCGLRVPPLMTVMKSAHRIGYCKGNMDSTQNVNVVFGEATVQNECFGVYQEHLHLQCNRCGYRSLMATFRKAAYDPS